jgi:putative transcriptional regulator
MVSFMTEALHSPNVFDETEKVHDLNNVASVWIAGKDVVRIREDREATINAIEAGRYDPSLPLAFKISRVFRLRIEEIFEDGSEIIRTELHDDRKRHR